jgi:hypothetical protein
MVLIPGNALMYMVQAGDPHLLDRSALEKAFNALPVSQQQLLVRTANRIRTFAGSISYTPLIMRVVIG